jgi:cytochrome c peroxidase
LDLPLVQSGAASLRELVQEGEWHWYFDAPLEGEPFGMPVEVLELYFGSTSGPPKRVAMEVMEAFARTGLVLRDGEDLPRGLVRTPGENGLVTQNCSACHSGEVKDILYAGVGNKFYNQKAIIGGARALMKAAIPLLLARGANGALERTRKQLQKLERYDALYGKGCRNLAPGMITAARIWQISSKLLHDPAQLLLPEGQQRFMCGSTKPPPLNTLRFRNLLFWDGSVNTLWVAHWPMFDFFGFDNYPRWERKVKSRAIQALDAFVVFGTRSPSWREVMGTPIHGPTADRGYAVFHRQGMCASCHGTYGTDGMLQRYQSTITPLHVVGTHPERAQAAFDDLMKEFSQYGWAYVPRLEHARDYGVGYAALPLCSTFMNHPYLHTGAVANLYELLLPEGQRSSHYTQSDLTDDVRVGYFTTPLPVPSIPAEPKPPPRVLLRSLDRGLLQGHSGQRFGTQLPSADRWALLEYLKTLRCPEEAGAWESSLATRH